MIIEVESLDAFKDIMKEAGDKLLVVDFTAMWCGPCKGIAPVFVKLSDKPENKNVVFLKVDVDEAEDIAAEYGIECMPTFLFCKNGAEVHRFSGANVQTLEAEVEARR
ncbi:thioredoxin-like [Genypterus blacodes]|uniref:thioredoxin-like n=1 Tax=Genypterus blacodes TaxID=154954 RepID=UPI003F76EB90